MLRDGCGVAHVAPGKAIMALSFVNASAGANMAHFVVTYTLPPDYFERRGPYKEGHRRHLAEAEAAGSLVIAGAFGNPPAGATYVFVGQDVAEAFARTDPYVTGGVATHWSIAPWRPVVGPGVA
jgi:uncharacterized protein